MHWLPAALVMTLMIMLGACGGDGGAPTTAETTSTTTQTQDGVEAQIPEQFPQPDDVEDFDTLTLTSEDVHVQWEVGMSTADAVGFYDQALPDKGWEVTSRREGGDSTRFAITGHGWEGAVTVLGGDPVRILLQLGAVEAG